MKRKNKAVTQYLVLSETHWDCECVKKYIHPNNIEKCEKCNAERKEQPNSRLAEVRKLNRKKEESYHAI